MGTGPERRIGRVHELTRRLRAMRAEFANPVPLQSVELPPRGEWQTQRAEGLFGYSPAVDLVREIAAILLEADQNVVEQDLTLPPNEFWSIGTIAFSLPIRTIHGGYVEPLLTLPLVFNIPEPVLYYLIAVPGERDLLDREHHDAVGWHYHYLDFRERRSNLLLSWDTRASSENQTHPFFQESHGEGRAKFTARPDLWGERKRQSMHDVCYPDLGKWNISSFRCASAKASPVWPTHAVLTPISTATTPRTAHSAKKARKTGR